MLRTLRTAMLMLACTTCAASSAIAHTTPPPVEITGGWQLQDIAKVAGDGAAVSRPGYRPDHWYRATVPGTVLTSLVNDGVYPEPLYGENNRPDKIPESLCRTAYWYRTTFPVPASFAGRHIRLNFKGINYSAEVWVNGHAVGTIKGAFARGTFDVGPWVSTGRTNALAVRILPPPHPGDPIEHTVKNGLGKNGGITAIDGPTFLCTIGWDWIPGIRDRDMGIWQAVTLSASGPVVVDNPYVTTDLPLPRTDSADLTVEATVRNSTDQPRTGVLVGTIEKTEFRQSVTLAPRETRTVIWTPTTTPQLHFLRPRLWWPNGYGAPNLYKLHLAFTESNAVSDTADINFGIRKLTYRVPGSENLTVSVNGVPVLCKGGDWGLDEAMKRIPRKRLEAQIRMHRDANYTMIRNWVGQSTSEDFYDLCDRYGILLWDEMFQPNPSDGPNPTDIDLYLANVREKILRFRSHPSIAVWCARNEGFPPPVIDAGIQKLMAELEHGRLYQPSSTSGRGVNSGGPYHWRTPREFYDFGEAFKTEIGSVSIPTLESVKGMMPEKDWNTINDDWAEHDLARGAQGGDWYPSTLGKRYGAFASLADFVRKAQLANYEAFRAIYEGRNAKLFKPVTGVITWMSNPAQPSFVWQIYSHDLEPNASLFGTKAACEPVHVQLNQNNWHVMVINNTPAALSGVRVTTAVYNLDGTLRYTHRDTVSAAPSAATDLGEVAFPDGLSPVHFVKVTLDDASGKPLSSNFYWRADPAHQDDFTALNTLPQVRLQATARRHDTAGKCLIDVTLRNPTKSIALMTHLQLRKYKADKPAHHGGQRVVRLGDEVKNAVEDNRVLPVFYSENYVSLLPGESRTISVEADQTALGPNLPEVVVDGWNVTADTWPRSAPANVIVRENSEATPVPLRGEGALPVVRPELFSLNIDCGGEGSRLFTFGSAALERVPSSYAPDQDFVGGKASSVGDQIDAQRAGHTAAPESVYQSERWGACAYTIPVPVVAAGKSYTVRLHFADSTFNHPGERKFNVALNGVRRLTDLNIIGESGGKDRVLVKEFLGVAPNGSGNIVIELSNGSADQPEIRAIQVFASDGAPTAPSASGESLVPVAKASAPAPVNLPWNLGTFVKIDAANPILSPSNATFPDPMTGKPVAWEKDHTFNPAAVVRNGKVYVIYRAEDDSGEGIGHHTSRLGLAESSDGIHFTRRLTPILFPAEDSQSANEWPGGCEDPRVVETPDGGYVLTYTQWNRKLAQLAVATSKDLIHWEKRGPAFARADGGKYAGFWTKSGAIITRRQGDHLIATKINGTYWMLYGEGTISAATSNDLLNWSPVLDTDGKIKAVFGTRKGKFDSDLVEGGPPAVLTDKGIVMLYNSKNAVGANGDPTRPAGSYSAGLALLDPKDPTRVLERGESYFFTPEKPYELTGQYAAGTTFIEGLVHFKECWFLYYGTADSFVAVAATRGR